ncbi:uncharacterized protein EAF02_010070 [Botrytis sinoallii]|uniref:uncharacterized protein n=1 Tax=Botrytis sinoallii TaxID=1463999 RepID=UPI0019016BDD|nr:uncharacterized protein EAF02_010070 [Botrytis sinoallii]KAF7865647.1 hypothetical protein EAF02_010070 [Botrytis sinoallii]
MSWTSTQLAERSPSIHAELWNPDSSLLKCRDLSNLPQNTETLLFHILTLRIIHSLPNAKTPSTPLNKFLLSQISAAKTSITIYTPNITYTPVINSIFEALDKGVDVRIVVSRKLMILEQLVTAGTITEWEVWKMKRRYRKLVSRSSRRVDDIEAGNSRIGALEVVYFNPALVRMSDSHNRNTMTDGTLARGFESMGKESKPVKLHLKMTIIDNEITILGSGNMDRASWVTSQELGVAIFSEEVSNQLIEVARGVYG